MKKNINFKISKNLIFVFIMVFVSFSYSYTQSTISFAGINWIVKSGTGGPGPNNWSNSSNSVWVDGSGNLHLKIRKVGNTWYCAEIYAQESFCYGEYRFYVASKVENYDKNIVAGLFTYETDSREIDIEFSRWGSSSNVAGWYTVQPAPYNSINQQNFALNLSGDYSTHKFIWNSSDIFFQSYHGHYAILPGSSYLIKQWTYTGNNIPPVGNERLHINFWLMNGNPPANQQEAELIINAVFVPTNTLPAQPNAITVTTPVCRGRNGINYSVPNVSGVTYTWTYSGSGCTIVSGQGTNSITANFSTNATSGTLTVTPSNSCGNGTSRTFNNIVKRCTEIDDIKFVNFLNIFPNPNTGEFTIEMEVPKILDLVIKLFNTNGQEIYTEKLPKYIGLYQKKISVAKYAKGIYNLQLISNEGIVIRKIIVQ